MRKWVPVWALVFGLVSSNTVLSTNAEPGRSSDPDANSHNQIDIIGPEPNVDGSDTPDVPLGLADTIENDIPGHPLSPEDFEHADTIVFSPLNLEAQVDPIELAGKFEGDIVIEDGEIKLMTEGLNVRPAGGGRDVVQDNEILDDVVQDNAILDDVVVVQNNEILDTAAVDPVASASVEPVTRNAITKLNRRWSAGVIPYVISSSYKQEERATIARAISKYHEKTCIRFVPRTVEKDYIHILKGDGCSSAVGRVGGAQAVSLGLGCLYVGIVMHELMHAAGFWHEQSRQDRDKFITINWYNIQAGMAFNFEKYNWQKIQSLGVEYDPSSIMHYGPYAFAKDRSKPTIIPRTLQAEIGQRRGFSKTDALKLNKLYSCAGTAGGVVEPTTTEQPITTTPPGHCADNNKYCSTWSDLGECEKNPTWMNVNCKKSCRQCGKECQDQNTYCNYWKERGECTKNAEYMGLFCQKSCERCHLADETISFVCEDKNRHCAAWSEMGQCRANPNYMMIYCKEACDKCRQKI